MSDKDRTRYSITLPPNLDAAVRDIMRELGCGKSPAVVALLLEGHRARLKRLKGQPGAP